MRLTNDDETGHVSNIFLGPKGWLLPWTARYSAYGIGFSLFILALVIERRFGIRPGIWSMAYTLAIVVFLTREIGRRVTFETPLRALCKIFWHEITAPRPDKRGQSAQLKPGKIRNTWEGKVSIR